MQKKGRGTPLITLLSSGSGDWAIALAMEGWERAHGRILTCRTAPTCTCPNLARLEDKRGTAAVPCRHMLSILSMTLSYSAERRLREGNPQHTYTHTHTHTIVGLASWKLCTHANERSPPSKTTQTHTHTHRLVMPPRPPHALLQSALQHPLPLANTTCSVSSPTASICCMSTPHTSASCPHARRRRHNTHAGVVAPLLVLPCCLSPAPHTSYSLSPTQLVCCCHCHVALCPQATTRLRLTKHALHLSSAAACQLAVSLAWLLLTGCGCACCWYVANVLAVKGCLGGDSTQGCLLIR
jgi:hypothetical protein